MKLLLIEDDLDIGSGVQRALHRRVFDVVWVRTLASAMTFAQDPDFAVAVLDLGLPDGDGMAWLAALRRQGGLQPVLILSARDSLNDRLEGLHSGADDFLVKPFELAELTARLQAMARRVRGFAQASIRGSGLELDIAEHRAYFNGSPVHLSLTEFRIVHLLMTRQGRVVPRVALEEEVLTKETAKSLDMHMSNLRKKLGRDTIRTVRGIGYAIERCEPS